MSVTTTQPEPTKLPAQIEGLLARLRRRIRGYIWAHGLATIVLIVGAGFWISLALDWIFEPPAALRVALMLALGAALVYAAGRYLVGRSLVRLRKRNMALLLERRYSNLGESLLTTVELADEPDWRERYSDEMVRETQRRALESLNQVELASVLNLRPLLRTVAAAALVAASVVVFGLWAQSAFGIWARRSLLLSPEIWPRKTRLVAEGFTADGTIKVARGSNLRLIVKAEAAPPREVPEIVDVRWTDASGTRNRENMSRDGVAAAGVDPFQFYSYEFRSVLSPFELSIHGGDDRLGPLRVEIVESPTITKITARCSYPSYMARQPRDLAASGMLLVPRGTAIAISARSNKRLVGVQIDESAGEKTFRTLRLDMAHEPATNFSYSIPPLMEDRTLLFSLHDSDQIRSREPIRLALAVRPDEAPEVSMMLHGIGTAITSSARLPASGEIVDDYGVAKAWFEYRVGDGQSRRHAIATPAALVNKLPLREAFEVAPLDLKPKQKLQFAIRAADNYRLASAGPNASSSQTYSLDIVTPGDLRAMLETRELMLRRRFETMIQEFTETRDAIASLDFGGRNPAAPVAKPATAQGAAQPPSAEAALELRKVYAERVLQNTERTAHETREVALAFDEIREELINNRVDTEDLKKRLKIGISEPLKKIAATDLARLQATLRRLEKQLADLDAGSSSKHEASKQADATLVKMKAVLERMLELESFNEVVDMLRDIIGAQQQVIDDTKKAQRQQLKDLIGD